jgi:hypothetical protein
MKQSRIYPQVAEHCAYLVEGPATRQRHKRVEAGLEIIGRRTELA